MLFTRIFSATSAKTDGSLCCSHIVLLLLARILRGIVITGMLSSDTMKIFSGTIGPSIFSIQEKCGQEKMSALAARIFVLMFK